MAFGTATLLIVFFVVLAASLASYLLSLWPALRGRISALGWIGITVGVSLFLGAALIAVVSTTELSALRWLRVEPEQQARIGATPARGDTADSETEPSPADPREARADEWMDRRERDLRDVSKRENVEESIEKAPSGAAMPTSRTDEGPASGRSDAVLNTGDPWAATRCVRAFHPDPSDLLRWTVENNCGEAVAIVVGTCDRADSECKASQAPPLWKYQPDGMVLPSKAQRAVSEAEETQHGREIFLIACFITTPLAIRLIGQPSEVRATVAWHEQFDTLRERDDCLARVRRTSHAGIR